MLSMRIDSLVAGIVRQILIEGGGKNGQALHFHFDCRMGYYAHVNDGSESYSAARGLHLLYYLPEGMTYVSVFSGITDSPFDKVSEVKGWKHESTHDSCWRDDVKAFGQVYFGMAEEINAQLKQDGHPEVAPAAMSEHNSFRLMGPVFDFIPVKVEKDPEDKYNHRRIITLL